MGEKKMTRELLGEISRLRREKGELGREITQLRLDREHYKNQLMLARHDVASLKADRDYTRSCLEDAYSGVVKGAWE